MMISCPPPPTRPGSVHFAATSQVILIPPLAMEILGDVSPIWYTSEDIANFQKETLRHALEMRASLSSVRRDDFSQEDLINCTGVESLLLQLASRSKSSKRKDG